MAVTFLLCNFIGLYVCITYIGRSSHTYVSNTLTMIWQMQCGYEKKQDKQTT